MTFADEALVKDVDRGHLARSGKAARVIDHGKEVLHLDHLLWFVADPAGGPSLLLRPHLPNFDSELSMRNWNSRAEAENIQCLKLVLS